METTETTETTEEESKKTPKRRKRYVLLTYLIVIAVFTGASFWMCYEALRAEGYARYMGVRNVSAEKVAKIIRGVELNALNIFDEVEAHHSDPDEVIEALRSKANLNYDVRGYFAAFEPDYFPDKGTWFEPYIYQPETGGFEYRQVGSARHNYHKSPWYIRAKSTGQSFWSQPYYYYDGTPMSGHYSTFIRPLFEKGQLECVLGADMKFEWLAKELEWVDNSSRSNKYLNKYHIFSDFDFYSIILDEDGTCIAHPGEDDIAITDEKVLQDLKNKQSGVEELTLNGKECIVYYGPIEYVDWSIAVVVPQWEILKPMLPIAGILIAIAFFGLVAMWVELRKQR